MFPDNMVLCGSLLYTLVLLVYGIISGTSAFNLDVAESKLFQGPLDSQFGYSIALYLNNFTGSRVIVGAPKANTSTLIRQNITNSGGLYSCPVDDSDDRGCRLYSVDDRPNARTQPEDNVEPRYFGTVIEDRSNQRLGASVTTNRNGVIAVCAPLYVYYGLRGSKREPTGDCWVSKDYGARFIRTSPCTTEFLTFYKKAFPRNVNDTGWASYHKTGHGMCGFSLTLGTNNELGIGAPGNYYFHGSLYSASPPNYRNFVSTGLGEQGDDNSYMSWDTKFGEFDGISSTIDYVVSAPRADMLRGKILFWSKRAAELYSLANITGEQQGAFFGYALAVGNFGGQNTEDVAVGAPLFAVADKPELGRVYTYYQRRVGSNIDFTDMLLDAHTGKDMYGRFGLSLANVGDLNLDGFDDLMVGAPYGGPDKRGVVYLYTGSAEGLSKEPVQVIHSEDVSTSPIYTFGWSIAGNMDVDGNMYTDVAVGAYKSNSVVLIKSRPVINLETTLTTPHQRIQLPIPCSANYEEEINKTIALDVTLCVEYTARNDPGEISVSATIKFDASNNNTKRAFEVATTHSSVKLIYALQTGQRPCLVVNGYIQPNIRDKISPLDVTVELELLTSRAYDDGSPSPVLDVLASDVPPLRVEFLKSCRICTPNLSIDVSTTTSEYVLGTEEKINFDIELYNSGEDSYLTTLNITLPEDVDYASVLRDDSQCVPIVCQKVAENDTMANFFICDVGNPFPSEHRAKYTLQVELESVHNAIDTEFKFGFNIESNYAADEDVTDNVFEVSIPLKADTSVVVTGVSKPSDAIIYNNSQIQSHLGPVIEHKYDIYTNGPSRIKTADFTIMWPVRSFDHQEHFLSIYRVPEIVQGDASCSSIDQYINTQNVSLNEGRITNVGINRGRSTRSVDKDKYLTCDEPLVHCIPIRCTLRNLDEQKSIVIKIHSFLWLGKVFSNLTANYSKEAVITSSATATIVELPYAVSPEVNKSSSFVITSYLEQYKPPKIIKPLEWKWIAIGIGCGVLLLIIIIVILWRCGFFKRYRPYAEAKREKHKDGQPHEVERLYSSYN